VLRFLPDGWLQTVLRPFIMADPVAGIYFELPAPDIRFAALLLLLPLSLWAGNLARWGPAAVWRLPLTIGCTLYLWTLVIGNGRYFIAGLLVVGPLLLWAVREGVGTAPFRATLAATLVAMQAGMVWNSYTAGQWSVAQWHQGSGLPMPAHPLREKPAIFLTVSPISHSLLVAQFHPQSRWSNIAGQRDLVPGSREFEQLRGMLASPLERYVVVPMTGNPGEGSPDSPDALEPLVNPRLAVLDLQMRPQTCSPVVTHLLLSGPRSSPHAAPSALGYWFCPLGPAASPHRVAPGIPDGHAAAFRQMEAMCPRLFPPGSGQLRRSPGVSTHHYPGTDISLSVVEGWGVTFRYFRALNPTFVGSLDDVLQGRAKLDCLRIDGRYRFPWDRE
jgi:hypothetical protein